jgi:hypothetical protein
MKRSVSTRWDGGVDGIANVRKDQIDDVIFGGGTCAMRLPCP